MDEILIIKTIKMKKTKGLLLAILIVISINQIYGQQCISCQNNNVSLLKFASAIGAGNQSTGITSLSFGFDNIAEGDYSASIGRYLHAGGIKSIVIGSGYTTNYKLINNWGNSLMIGFNSDVPTFFVTGSNGKGNTGRIGIGDMGFPQHKLHIKADASETAAVMIEPDNWAIGQPAFLYLGATGYGISNDTKYGMVFTSPGNFLFGGKNVGINITNPEYTLHVNGSMYTKSFRLFDEKNEPREGYVLTSDNEGNGYWYPNQYLWTQGNGDDIYRELGYVGIGVKIPTERLHVSGNIQVDNNIVGRRGDTYEPLKIMANHSDIDGAYISLASIYNQEGSIKLFARGSSGRIEFNNQNRQIMSIRENNNVYFGDPNNPTHLYVNGEVNASLVRVTVETWEDRVFNPDYQLLTLYEVEAFIQSNHHLPDIPSEQQVKEEGVDIGEMNALLLKKIEELTLYVIELKKENEEIRKEMDVIKKQ